MGLSPKTGTQPPYTSAAADASGSCVPKTWLQSILVCEPSRASAVKWLLSTTAVVASSNCTQFLDASNWQLVNLVTSHWTLNCLHKQPASVINELGRRIISPNVRLFFSHCLLEATQHSSFSRRGTWCHWQKSINKKRQTAWTSRDRRMSKSDRKQNSKRLEGK